MGVQALGASGLRTRWRRTLDPSEGSNPSAPARLFECRWRCSNPERSRKTILKPSLTPTAPGRTLIGRLHPAGDLSARVEPELVHDAADVAVDGALGYEQAC